MRPRVKKQVIHASINPRNRKAASSDVKHGISTLNKGLALVAIRAAHTPGTYVLPWLSVDLVNQHTK
jgi:hypothetical protein